MTQIIPVAQELVNGTFTWTVPTGSQFIGLALLIGGSNPTLTINGGSVGGLVGDNIQFGPVTANAGDVLAASGSSAAIGITGLLFPTTYASVLFSVLGATPTTYTVPVGFFFVGLAGILPGTTNATVIVNGYTLGPVNQSSPFSQVVNAQSGWVISTNSGGAFSLNGLLFPNV